MPITTTYSHARDNLAALWNAVEEEREVVIIERPGHRSVALIHAAELRPLEGNAHLLRSPANAIRLLTALHGSLQGKGTPFTVEELRRERAVAEEG
ncbi:type II toxin-antitoxin system prevent-host-death family antitoxin [soil metagenome]|nr:type II toxin-antitoxin system Phd/YefM family antitoxin [Gemmatimonadota bacterium]